MTGIETHDMRDAGRVRVCASLLPLARLTSALLATLG